jgi:O-antigen/teichoic acid export membrane protein
VNFVAILGMIMFLVLLVPLLYGSGFDQTTTLGLILVPGTVALGLAETLASSLVGRGHNECARKVAFTVTPITIALYAIVIPTLHAPGAAVASTISYTLTFAMWAHFYRRHVDSNLVAVMRPSTAEFVDYRELLTHARRALARRPS